MKITNKANLPLPLVRAVENDPYDASGVDYSTTTLIKPPRIVALERKHKDEIEEDASDRIWALIGQIGHLILERAATEEIRECRYRGYMGNRLIGGQVDLLLEGHEFGERATLVDYKFVSQWAAKDGVKPEWEQQHNVNAWLCRQNGIEIAQAQIVAIYRDWLIGEARRNKSYPQQQVQVFPVQLWSPERQVQFVSNRIALHEAAKENLPECTALERWARGEKWAVMSKGGVKAMRLFDTEAEAANMANTNGKFYVEHRPATQTRCLDYCSVAPFCQWWQDYKKEHPQ